MSETMHRCTLSIDGAPFSFDVEGECCWGDDELLFNEKGVISRTAWKRDGYTKMAMFDAQEQKTLLEGTTRVLASIFDQLGFAYPSDFQLANYHKVVTTKDMHQQVIRKSRMLTNKDFPIDIEKLAERVSHAIGRKVSPRNRTLETMENSPAKEIVQLRISRPHSLDINPLHRDGYLDFYKHTLNIWIPIVGCNEGSSLPLLPGSHLWNEKDVFRTDIRTAKIDGLVYSVPAIVKSNHGLSAVRPNPALGEMLVFSPFLIHGAAINKNEDMTRMSFELRLFDEEYDA